MSAFSSSLTDNVVADDGPILIAFCCSAEATSVFVFARSKLQRDHATLCVGRDPVPAAEVGRVLLPAISMCPRLSARCPVKAKENLSVFAR